MWIAWMLACVRTSDVETGETGDAETDTETDTETETGETETEETDPETETEETDTTPPECLPPPTPSPGSAGLGACITAQLEHGHPVTATTIGGLAEWGDDRYAAMLCGSNDGSQDYAGAERAYLFDAAPGGEYTFTLTPHCGPLSLRVVRIAEGSDPCREVDAMMFCDRDAPSNEGAEQAVIITTTSNPARLVVIVDSIDGYEGTFTLGVN